MVEEHKIVMAGTHGVGKSCVSIQFIQNIFVEEYDPTIEDGYRKQFKVDEVVCLFDILDSVYQEEYLSLTLQFYRSSDGIIIVYSCTDRSSFESVDKIVNDILQIKEEGSFPMILVSNKSDLHKKRVVSTDEGRCKAQELNIPFIETSAKDRVNIDETFCEIVREIHKYNLINQPVNKTIKRTKKCIIL